MRGKAALIIGLATGYVLGTRDGRARYQQIKTQANRIISDPRVQQKANQATDLAKAKAPLVKDKLADVTDKATSKVSSSSVGSGSDLPAQTTTSTPDLTYSPSDPLDTELDTDLDSSDVSDVPAGPSTSPSAGTPAEDADTSSTSSTSSTSTGGSDSTSSTSSDRTDRTDNSDDGDSADDDVVVLTPPSPSPLAPGPTQTDSSNPATGGSHG
jgi:hypothetical protein